MKEVTCSYCGKEYLRSPNRIHEAIKFGWKQYCSHRCQYKAKIKQKEFICANPSCRKLIKRRPKDTYSLNNVFCSYSCSAKMNNKNKIKWKTCITCGNKYYGSNKKFCSKGCTTLTPPKPTIKITSEQVTKELKDFYKTNGRVPLKREYKHMKAARNRFGTWNKAIIAAGFKPNPIRFANKYVANDGHKCDSMAEKIIDDWLYEKNIKHETKIPYNYHRMTADFKIGDTYIEFFGLQGELESYDKLIKEKERLWKKKNLDVIRIYPGDLFPKNKLEQIFATLGS